MLRLLRARARHQFVRSASAGLGLAVSAALFAVAPAQGAPAAASGALGPFPQVSGAGSIVDTATGTTCTSGSATGLLTCDMLPSLVGALTPTTLTAVPAATSQFTGWTNCPGTPTDAAHTTCTVGALSTLLLAPVATFVPLPGTGGGTTDPTGTLTTILTPVSTTGPDVVFRLATDPADAAATFTCTLTRTGGSASTAPCGPSVTYTDLAPGDYTLTALATSEKFLKSTPASSFFTVAGDTPLAPETTVTGGPANHGWLLATATRFGLGSSSQLPVTYTCTLDGQPLACTNPVPVSRLSQRTHVFTAAASSLGVADATPATRVFTVPVNNTKLKASAGWAKRKAKGHFLNTFSQTKRHGATLKVRRSAIRSVALVVAKGRGYGTVKVYLGKKLLKKVSLRANRTVGQRVVPIKKFSSKKRGTVTVKVVSRGKLVRIEGLGISSR